MPKILYISYWGALEQLGQSLVVPAVKKLAQMGAQITVVTFEKTADLKRSDEMKRVGAMFAEDRIEWIPLQYHKDPKIPATLFDIAHGTARGLQQRLKGRFDIVHARTFTGGLIGMLLAPLIRAKFIYHNEGFYPDEQVDGGVWAKDSRPHRIAKKLENLMYSRASGIIALSYNAKAVIEKLPNVLSKKIPVIVVPSCVDLDKFQLPVTKTLSCKNLIDFVYVGSISGRYIFDKVGAFIAAIQKIKPDVSLQVYSKVNADVLADILGNSGLSKRFWNLKIVSYDEMPESLIKHQAGISFLKSGISQHGGSPTKIGEYWAVGLPVVTTPNVSDTDEIIHRERVGVIVKEHTEEAYLKAFTELQELIKDPQLALRCRRAAENHYALAPACERQIALYEKLSNR